MTRAAPGTLRTEQSDAGHPTQLSMYHVFPSSQFMSELPAVLILQMENRGLEMN